MPGNLQTDDFWLETHLDFLGAPTSKNRILELGCGTGRDTKFLVDRGFNVTATDVSKEHLEACIIKVPKAAHHLVDLRQVLPFADNTFSVVLASLCLHYFEWNKTQEVITEIRRCLQENGLLIARVNSTNDMNYGAVGFEEIAPNFYSVRGKTKRFFSADALTKLFVKGWDVVQMEERAIDRYDKPKVVWQVVARRNEQR